jgi:hypothetical protein
MLPTGQVVVAEGGWCYLVTARADASIRRVANADGVRIEGDTLGPLPGSPTWADALFNNLDYAWPDRKTRICGRIRKSDNDKND